MSMFSEMTKSERKCLYGVVISGQVPGKLLRTSQRRCPWHWPQGTAGKTQKDDGKAPDMARITGVGGSWKMGVESLEGARAALPASGP